VKERKALLLKTLAFDNLDLARRHTMLLLR